MQREALHGRGAFLYLSVAIVTVIFSILMVVIQSLSFYIYRPYSWGLPALGIIFALPMLGFVLPMLTYPFRRWLKLSMTSLTYLFVIGVMISHTSIYGFIEAYPSWFSLFRINDPSNVLVGWWMPPDHVSQDILLGGAVINWFDWASSIFFWTSLIFLFYLFFSSISIVLRRLWINIERMPFPVARAGYDIMKVIEYDSGAKKDLKPFVLGLILGLAFEVPIFLTLTFPWFPDIYSWRTDTCCPGIWSVPADNILGRSIVGFCFLNKHPLSFGLSFLAPLSVSFNCWFWTLVMMIIEQIAYYMGYYTGILEGTHGCGRAMFCGGVNLLIAPPYRWALLGIGSYLGIMIFHFVLNRTYLADTVKAALKRPTKLSESEEDEPVSYRTAYIILIGSPILITALIMSVGIDLMPALTVIFPTALVANFAGALIWAHTGANGTYTWTVGSWWAFRSLWPQLPEGYSTNWVMSHFLGTLPGSNFQGFQIGLYGTPMCFAMADWTKTSNKKIFRVSTLSLLIALPVTMMTSIWVLGTFGFTKLGGGAYGPIYYGGWAGGFEVVGATPLPDELSRYLLIGFVSVGLLSWLHSTYVWFPFEPLGFTLATSGNGIFGGIWSSMLVAWIIKTIVLRVGGSKSYEKVAPIVGGYLAGYVIISGLVAGIVGPYRHFFPF